MNKPGLKISRRRFLGGVSFLAAGSFGYAHFIEARWLHCSRVTVPLFRGARPTLKLLHLSDLHASALVSLEFITEAIDRALAFRPDLICVTGDFITTTFDDLDGYARVLRRLSDAAPCFAVLGNHDGGAWAAEHRGHADLTWVTTLLKESRLHLLLNTSQTFTTPAGPLNVVGLGDTWAGPFAPAAAFAGANPALPTVVLSHNPDTKSDLAPYRWDLMLSGHTHGGQLRLPVIGAPFAPVIDKRFLAGLYRWEDRWLHITRGVGNVFGMRINCPPEVSFITLT